MIARPTLLIAALLTFGIVAYASPTEASTTNPSQSASSASANDVDPTEEIHSASADDPKDAAATNAEINASEAGVPASIDYPNRPQDPAATNAEIDAAEQGNPDALPNRDESEPSDKEANKQSRKSDAADPSSPSVYPASP